MQGSRARTLDVHAESRFQDLDSRMCGRAGVLNAYRLYGRLPISITHLSVICRLPTARRRLRNNPSSLAYSGSSMRTPRSAQSVGMRPTRAAVPVSNALR
jgi:hypothetical protein